MTTHHTTACQATLWTSRRNIGNTVSCMIILWMHSAQALVASYSSSGYITPSTLERLAQASSLSYLSPLDKMTKSPYFQPSRLEPLLQVVDPISESGATIFRDTNRIVVACRGSANPKNFGTNLKFKLVPATRLSQTKPIPDKAMIHEGFQDASVGLWRRLGPQLLEVLEENKSIEEVIFTGHSLGAATALLCAVHYSATADTTSSSSSSSYLPTPTVITFGGPKLCNGVLARYIRNDVLQDSNAILHLVHDQDPVLANNQKLWKQLGFEDVGVELQCDPTSPIVYTDDTTLQMKKKRSLFGAWNIMDHCKYMGVFVGPRL